MGGLESLNRSPASHAEKFVSSIAVSSRGKLPDELMLIIRVGAVFGIGQIGDFAK